VGGFLAAKVLLLKQIGVGIGLTIFLDATLIRIILVPAFMAILGFLFLFIIIIIIIIITVFFFINRCLLCYHIIYFTSI
jgi:uncharacterized membrane protein YdfJ with MMPL/SSD domain